jgi:O-antigen ligase/polysaccharide polymerase Wzy-like membrane protein
VSGSAAGSLIAVAGMVPLLVATRPLLRALGLALWTAGVGVLAADLLHSPISRLRVEATDRPLLAVAAILVGGLLLAAAAFVVHRRPWLLLLAAVAAAPARIPVHAGGAEANLLLPLYVVIAAAWLAAAWEIVRGTERPPELGRLGWAVAAFMAWSGITMMWTADEHQGAVSMLFFLLPFGFLLTRLAPLRPGRRELRLALGLQAALACLFGAVALWQFATKDVFWNPKVIVGNQYASFFRVNSLFWDASIYGRFMAVTMVLLAGIAVYRRMAPPLVLLIAFLFAAMYVSYSQSSMFALGLGALTLGVALWPRRVIVGVAATAGALGMVALVIALHGNSAETVTSDRTHLLDLGRRVIEHHPLVGAGNGGFARAALAGTPHPWHVGQAASHTTPVTVLAELGPLGLAAYLWLLVEAARLGLRHRRDPVPHMVLLAALTAIVASSLFYNAFFEDPQTWILLALLATVRIFPKPQPGASA